MELTQPLKALVVSINPQIALLEPPGFQGKLLLDLF